MMFMILGLTTLIGQYLFFLGTSWYSFSIMIIGRIIFGYGCESIFITQSTIISQYFSKNQLSLAMVRD